jgi:hypothetical protein
VHVRRVAGEQHSTGAVGGRLTGHVVEARDPGRAVHAEVRAVRGDERIFEVLQRGVGRVLDLGLGEHDPVRPAALDPVDRSDAAALRPHPDLRLVVELDLRLYPADGRVPSLEGDAGCLADDAASSVAPHQVPRTQRPAAGHADVDAAVALCQARHLALADDRHTQLVDPDGEDPFEVLLPEREAVVEARRKVADVERDVREPLHLRRLALREEPFRDAALIEHLERARVKSAGARASEPLIGSALDDHGVGPGQCQLRRQHHPGRTSADDHDVMIAHHFFHLELPPMAASVRPAMMRQHPVLTSSPRCSRY